MAEFMDDVLTEGAAVASAEPSPEPAAVETPTTGEQAAVSPAVEEPKPQTPDVERALRAEIDHIRRKNREYEAMLQQQQQPKEDPPDFWSEPEKVLGQMQSQFESKLDTLRIEMSEANARSRYQDYQAKLDVFTEMAQRDPNLFEAAKRYHDPAEYAYRTAEKVMVLRDMGDPAAFRKKIEQEVRQKLEAEFAARKKQEVEAAIAARLPVGFSETRSTGAPAKAEFAGPTPLGSILK